MTASVKDLMASCVFVEGTACVGKSSALRSIQTRLADPERVHLGDYDLDRQRFPPYLNKHRYKYLNKIYPAYLILKLEAYGVYDRCFFADFLYDVIFDIISGNYRAIHSCGADLLASQTENADLLHEARGTNTVPPTPPAPDGSSGCASHAGLTGNPLCASLVTCALRFLEPAMVELLRTLKVVVCLDEDADAVVGRMIERQNGIDILTCDYVNVQNAVFRQVAHTFDWQILTRCYGEDMSQFVERIAEAVLKLRPSKSLDCEVVPLAARAQTPASKK